MDLALSVFFAAVTFFFEARLKSLWRHVDDSFKSSFGFVTPVWFVTAFFSNWTKVVILIAGVVLFLRNRG